MSRARIINIPERDEPISEDEERDFCLGCGELKRVDAGGLCDDCLTEEEDDYNPDW